MKREADDFTVSGLTWHLDEEARDSQVARALALGRDPREFDHQVVKSNPHRRVLRFESNGTAFYLKEHNGTSRTERLKLLLFPSRARREWRAIKKMRRLGFHTPAPIAYAHGRTGSGHASILVTRAVEGASNLRAAIESLGPGRGLELSRSLGAQIRALHDKGVHHRDVQPGNILVAPADGGFRFCFIDLHKAVFTGRVSRSRRIKDLGQLVFNLSTFCKPALIDALLGSYAGGEPAQGFVKRIMRRAEKLRRIRKRSRARRCLRNSTRFTIERVGRMRIYRRREVSAEELLSVLKKYRATRKKVIAGAGAGPAYHVKEIEISGLYQNFKDLFQRPRGRRAWHAANALAVRGIPTPRPLALVEELFAGLIRRSYLLTEFVASGRTLSEYVHRRFVMESPPLPGVRAFLKELVRALAPLYGESIYHGDLKASNILVKAEPGGPVSLYITDLDGIQLWRSPHPSRVAKNLVQLYCSLPTCVARPLAARFFLRFLRETGLTPKLRDRLPEIARRAQRRRQRWIGVVRKYGKIL